MPRLDILGISIDAAIAQMLPGLRMKAGVFVVSLMEGALDSTNGGLMPGDVVFGVNAAPVPTPDDLRAAIEGLKSGDPLVLQVERRGERLYLSFTME